MSLVVHFAHFDPLTGKLPERYDWMFVEVAVRARRLLAGRTLDEINAAAKLLTHIERAPGYSNPLWDELKQPPVPTIMDGQEVELIVSSNEVEGLYKNVGNVSIADYPEFPNGQWHELFAVLALSYMEKVGGAVHAQETWQPLVENKWLPGRKVPTIFPRATDAMIDGLANECLPLARQAINFAETLQGQAAMVRNIRAKESSQAASKRHQASSGPLKSAVIELYKEKYQSRSNREAARRVFDELKQLDRLAFDEPSRKVTFDGNNSLQTDDPEKRFEIWIGQFKRKK